MKAILSTIVLLFLILGLFSYSPKKHNYINYHLTIHQAEKQIRQNQYDSAIFIYNNLRAEYPHMFYKDLHNLCICYLKLDEIKMAYGIAEKLVLQGYTLSDFENQDCYDKLTLGSGWDKFTKNYKKLRDQYLALNKVEMEDRNEIYRIAEIDDYAASTIASLKDGKTDSISYSCGKELEKLFLEKGFPSFLVNKDTLSHRLTIVLRHYYLIKSKLSYLGHEMPYSSMVFDGKLDSILRSALHKGLLLPEHYVGMTTYDYRNNPYGELSFLFDFKKENIKISLYPSNGYDSVNVKRKLIGLPPIEPNDTNKIYGSWLQHFSFSKVKEQLTNCDSCSRAADYMIIIRDEKLRLENLYNKDEFRSFLLEDISQIRKTYYIGMEDIMRRKKQ